jgi:hypothetical protein
VATTPAGRSGGHHRSTLLSATVQVGVSLDISSLVRTRSEYRLGEASSMRVGTFLPARVGLTSARCFGAPGSGPVQACETGRGRSTRWRGRRAGTKDVVGENFRGHQAHLGPRLINAGERAVPERPYRRGYCRRPPVSQQG